MSAPVAGKITLTSGGSKTFYIGIPVNKVSFYSGARELWIENSEMFSFGFACSSKQFTFASGGGKSEQSQSKAFIAYDNAGNKATEFTVTSGWGTNSITINVTTFNSNYPFDLVAET